jgi:hypothetical protein
MLEMENSSLFLTIFSHDWDGVWGCRFCFSVEFKGLGLDSFYSSCYIPRLYLQTLRWSILNTRYRRTFDFTAELVHWNAVMRHALIEHGSVHVIVSFSGD